MNIALIFAGGSGKRMNSRGVPKQFLEVNGKPIIILTIEHFEQHPDVDAICVVCIESWIEHFQKLLTRFDIKKVVGVVPGGNDGQESIRNGLNFIKDRYGIDDNIVLVHDGVRPLINEQVITDNIKCVKEYGSAITVVPATETIVNMTGHGENFNVLDRSQCFIARAPQSFYLKDILEAHYKAVKDGVSSKMVDSASLMVHYGYKLTTVEGPVENIKVTTPMDFYTCRAYIQQKEDSQIWGM